MERYVLYGKNVVVALWNVVGRRLFLPRHAYYARQSCSGSVKRPIRYVFGTWQEYRLCHEGTKHQE